MASTLTPVEWCCDDRIRGREDSHDDEGDVSAHVVLLLTGQHADRRFRRTADLPSGSGASIRTSGCRPAQVPVVPWRPVYAVSAGYGWYRFASRPVTPTPVTRNRQPASGQCLRSSASRAIREVVI